MKEKPKSYYRHPKTAQEKRNSYENSELIRAKRGPTKLVDERGDCRINRNEFKSWKSKRHNQYLDKDSKFYTLEIREIDGLTIWDNASKIEQHLEKIDVSYTSRYKFIDGEALYIIQYRGHHIGEWKGVKYV